MAIIKTNPAPITTVEDYKHAALRHFNTCKILWRYMSLPGTSNLKNIPEDFILKNVFYLSGYVVECALKYRYCTNHHGLNDTHQLTWAELNTRNVKGHFAFLTTNSERNWSQHIVQTLDLLSPSPIPNYLRKLGGSATVLTLSPIEEVIFDMQQSWEPSLRYHFEKNGLSVNKSDIETFYHATRHLLQNLSLI